MKQSKRNRLARKLERQIRPLIDRDKWDGGYNCCGCSTYDAILDHAIAIVRGEKYPPKPERRHVRLPEPPPLPRYGPPDPCDVCGKPADKIGGFNIKDGVRKVERRCVDHEFSVPRPL